MVKEGLMEADLDLEPELVWDREVEELPDAKALLLALWLPVPEALEVGTLVPVISRVPEVVPEELPELQSVALTVGLAELLLQLLGL